MPLADPHFSDNLWRALAAVWRKLPPVLPGDPEIWFRTPETVGGYISIPIIVGRPKDAAVGVASPTFSREDILAGNELEPVIRVHVERAIQSWRGACDTLPKE